MDQIQISAVAYKHDGLWIVQAIEYDIRARAYEREAVVPALITAIQERVALNEHMGRKRLEGIKAAPAKFSAMFKAAVDKTVAKNDGQVEVAFA